MKKRIPIHRFILLLCLIGIVLICALLQTVGTPYETEKHPMETVKGEEQNSETKKETGYGQDETDENDGSAEEQKQISVSANQSDLNSNTGIRENENIVSEQSQEVQDNRSEANREEHFALTHIPAQDRVVYQEGFYYESLTDALKERINGLSYKADCTVPYEELRYVAVKFYDFDNTEQIGEIVCNKMIAQDLIEIFYELYQNQYQIDKIRLVDEYDADDDRSCADNNTSCFNYRTVPGKTKLSNHARGLAIDINPFQNPYITYPDGQVHISPKGSEAYAERSVKLPHMIHEEDLCYQLFTKHGFEWGGHWKSVKDYQHFEKNLQ